MVLLDDVFCIDSQILVLVCSTSLAGFSQCNLALDFLVLCTALNYEHEIIIFLL